MSLGSKVNIKTAVFRQALERTDSVVSSNANPVAIRYVKLTFLSDSRVLVLESCENEGKSGVQAIIPVTMNEMISEDFSVLVDPKIALRILSRLKSEEITLEPFDNNTKLYIKTSKTKFELIAVPPGDFPSFPSSNSGKVFSISATTLKKMLGTIQPAIDKNEPRIALTGVCFNYANKNAYVVGMNGKILLLCSREVSISNSDFDIIIPYNALNPLVKHLPDGEEVEVEYTFSDIKNKDNSDIINIFFKTSAFTVVVKTFSKEYSKYPNWDRIIPGSIKNQNKEDITTYFLVDTESLQELVALASAVTDAKKPKIRFKYKVKDENTGELSIEGASEFGSAYLEAISCHHLGGSSDFAVDLNNQNLETLLSSIGTKEVQIRYKENGPIGIVCDSSGEIFTAGVIIPLIEESTEEEDEEVTEIVDSEKEEVLVGESTEG